MNYIPLGFFLLAAVFLCIGLFYWRYRMQIIDDAQRKARRKYYQQKEAKKLIERIRRNRS